MFDESKCPECGRIHFGILRYILRNEFRAYVKSKRRCDKCNKRGVYDENEGQKLCWECWTEKTGLPF